MKKIIILILIMISFSLFGAMKIVGESVENYSACGSSQNNLSYCHDQVDYMIQEWVSKGHTKTAWYKNGDAWATDLMDSTLISVGTDNYTDDVADLVVFSGHGGISGNSSTDLWSTTAMCPHNGYYSAQGRYSLFGEPDQNDVFSKAAYLVLFTCFSVHDFVKDNSSLPQSLQGGATWQEWKMVLRDKLYSIDHPERPVSIINMIFGFAGTSADSSYTDENGEDFIADMNVESQKQAWFTGNDDWYHNDRAGVITWGVHNGRYGVNSATDAIGRRDNHKLIDNAFVHGSNIAMAWSHHDC